MKQGWNKALEVELAGWQVAPRRQQQTPFRGVVVVAVDVALKLPIKLDRSAGSVGSVSERRASTPGRRKFKRGRDVRER